VLCQVDLKAVARTDVFNGSGNGLFETLASEIAENIGPSGKWMAYRGGFDFYGGSFKRLGWLA
jgi:hypothetical protein